MVEITRGKLKGVMVKAGDSWWKLSREFLGRGTRWRELLALNPGQPDPNFLAAGSEILVPATGDSLSKPPDKLLKVQEGDTLWGIAHARYGSGAAWTCLAGANAQLSDPNRIFPGQELLLPRSCKRRP
jgi:nucleoid-associated protein YgaU